MWPPALRPSQPTWAMSPLSTSTIPFIVTEPEGWYSFYHPTEGRRLSSLSTAVRCAACAKGSGWCDKRNWLQWDSNLGPLTPQPCMLSRNHCDPGSRSLEIGCHEEKGRIVYLCLIVVFLILCQLTCVCVVLQYTMLTGKPPFLDVDCRELSDSAIRSMMQRIKVGSYSRDTPEWQCISDDAKKLVQGISSSVFCFHLTN